MKYFSENKTASVTQWCNTNAMVNYSILASSAIDRAFVGLRPDQVKPKTIKFVFVASPLSTQYYGKRADWLTRNQDNVSEWCDICLSADGCFGCSP